MPIDKSKPLNRGFFILQYFPTTYKSLTPLPMAVYTYFNKIFENLSILTDLIRIYKCDGRNRKTFPTIGFLFRKQWTWDEDMESSCRL